ncbi:unnamed protein product [Amoebophrya sp. A25]|nr:unnamed protein product [Amoebophrya sp. A25]|eukprot:GSA25T00025674001.1
MAQPQRYFCLFVENRIWVLESKLTEDYSLLCGILKNIGLVHLGIGFITPDGNQDGDPDVLVHYQQIKQESEDGFKSLQEGSKVEFELADDPKDASKKVAINVTGLGGSDCESKAKGKGKGKKGGEGKKGKKGKGKGKGKKGDDEDS